MIFMQQAIQHHTNIAYGAMRVAGRHLPQQHPVINRQGGIDGIYNKNMLVIEGIRSKIAVRAQVQAIQTDFKRVTGCLLDLNFEQPLQDTARAAG